MSTSLSRRPLIRNRVLEVANAPKPRRSTVVFAPFDAAKQRRQLHARHLRDDFLQGVAPANARYPRAVMTAVDAPTMPLNCRTRRRRCRRASAVPGRRRRGVRCRRRRWRAAPTRRECRCLIVGGFGAGPVRVAGRVDLDRRQLIRDAVCCALRGGKPSETQRRKESWRRAEARGAAARLWMVEDMVQTSV